MFKKFRFYLNFEGAKQYTELMSSALRAKNYTNMRRFAVTAKRRLERAIALSKYAPEINIAILLTLSDNLADILNAIEIYQKKEKGIQKEADETGINPDISRTLFRMRKKEELEAEAKKAELLGLNKREPTVSRKYIFQLEQSLEGVTGKIGVDVLNQIGQAKYGTDNYAIGTFDSWTSWTAFLYHPKGLAPLTNPLDSITLHDDGKVEIVFERGKREISGRTKRKVLDEKAIQIYEAIKTGLQ